MLTKSKEARLLTVSKVSNEPFNKSVVKEELMLWKLEPPWILKFLAFYTLNISLNTELEAVIL